MYLVLMDNALRRIDQARYWMDDEDSFEKHHLLNAAVRIVGELRSTLDVAQAVPMPPTWMICVTTCPGSWWQPVYRLGWRPWMRSRVCCVRSAALGE